MTLGATQGDVVRAVLQNVVVLVMAGLALSVPVAFLVVHGTKATLAGLPGVDGFAMASSAATMVVLAFAAGYLPARRAARIDPVAALRQP